MTDSVVWFRGVPWLGAALARARAENDPGLVEVVTEIAREIRLVRHDRPEPGSRIEASRAGWTAVLSGELVVMGYGRAEEVSPSASDAADGSTAPEPGKGPGKAKKKGRGPANFEELIEWLGDEGFQVGIPRGQQHPVVYSPTGVRLVTLPGTPSESRGIKNATAICRRVLNIELRRAT